MMLARVKLPSFGNILSEATIPHSVTFIMKRIDNLTKRQQKQYNRGDSLPGS